MSEKESAADKAIREALESVERLERERSEEAFDPDADLDAAADQVELLDGGDPEMPPNGDPSTSSMSTPPAPADEPPKRMTADQMMIASLLKAKGEMQDALNQTQKEAKDMFDRLTRVSADFDNFKKRVGREKEDAIKFGNEKAFKEIIPVMDNLRRALQVAPADADNTFVDGVKLVAKQLEDAMARFGVVGFDSLGTPFDPVRHEAVGSRPDDVHAANLVCEEYQRGFMLHDRLIRPALVIVSAGPAS